MIVMKFGGSSVGGSDAMRQAAGIVGERRHRAPVVVLSAMAKTTDRLLECARVAAGSHFEEASRLLQEIRKDHLATAADCIKAFTVSPEAREIERHFTDLQRLLQTLRLPGKRSPRSLDAIASYGERLSTLIFTGLLKQEGIAAQLMDSRELIRTGSEFTRATPDLSATETRLRGAIPPVCRAGRIPVLQGFIGSDDRGVTTTLGRNGSDFSAAIVGALLDVEEIQIWTDVPGILTADPTLVPQARKIKTISFSEAAELAYFGAKVLHPSTLLPAVKKNIPVYVLNSRDPGGSGTRITAQCQSSRNPIKSIAYKEGLVMINVSSTRMLMAHGFLRRLFEIFERHERPVDMVATSEVSVSLTLDSAENLDAIVEDLSQIGEVQVARNKAIICLVGENLKFTPGIAARAFSAIDTVNIQMISQGASIINLGFVIDEDRISEAVNRLHDHFFSDPDPEIFE
ncbi:MAG: lysine-sensitive aspartokinase 3 [Acidobacteria bacterium]|nr:lysine-sensitive aspartokinase 3 [Acidobacteriota bacterium]